MEVAEDPVQRLAVALVVLRLEFIFKMLRVSKMSKFCKLISKFCTSSCKTSYDIKY